MKCGCLSVIFGLLATFCLPVYADQAPENILKAITRIRSTVPENARTARYLGTEREGNGVVIDSKGHILTIGYLILEAKNTEIVGHNGKSVSATVVAYDHNSGFGLLRANKPLKVEPMKLGQSSKLSAGDPVLVASYGGPAAVQGVRVVSRQEFAGYWEYLLDDAIFTVPPYPDFGGAALIGSDGQLVGIGSLYTQVAVAGVGLVTSNMFVPIDLLKPILSDLIIKGRSNVQPHPWLGVHAEESHGRLIVLRVSPGGPAEQAGIQPRDIILSVNKRALTGLADFYRKVWVLGDAGVDVPLSVLQGTRIREITVHSADRYRYLRLKEK